MNKTIITLAIAILLLIPVALASHNEPPIEDENGCSIFNLKNCFTGILDGFLNASLKPLLSLVENLLVESGSPELFRSLWAAIVFVCSFITFIFLTILGIKFIMCSDDPVKRYNAKKGLQTIVIISILLPLSFYFYDLILDMNGSLSSYFLNSTSASFLEIKTTGLLNSILNLLLYLIYLTVLILTVVILILRYLIVSLGIVILPIGLILYCFDSVKQYASLIINFLATNIFAGLIGAITLRIISIASSAEIFDGYQVVFGIAGFLIMDVVMLVCMLFVICKAAFGSGKDLVGLLKYFI